MPAHLLDDLKTNYVPDKHIGEMKHFLNDIAGIRITELDMREEEKLSYNAMFLTYEQARQYLDNNKHNHTHGAHVFAMTAYRNFELERFLEAFKHIDFTKSNIVFKDSEEN